MSENPNFRPSQLAPLTQDEIDGILRYWQQPTGMANAPGGMVELAQYNIGRLVSTIDLYRDALCRIARDTEVDFSVSVTAIRRQAKEALDV